MARVICKINIGLKNQTVYVQGEKYNNRQTLESFEMPIQNIANFIVNQQGISEVRLSGSKIYTEKIEDDVKELELKKYSKNKIKFIYDI